MAAESRNSLAFPRIRENHFNPLAIEADLSAVALSLPNGAKVEAVETDKTLRTILMQIGYRFILFIYK